MKVFVGVGEDFHLPRFSWDTFLGNIVCESNNQVVSFAYVVVTAIIAFCG